MKCHCCTYRTAILTILSSYLVVDAAKMVFNSALCVILVQCTKQLTISIECHTGAQAVQCPAEDLAGWGIDMAKQRMRSAPDLGRCLGPATLRETRHQCRPCFVYLHRL